MAAQPLQRRNTGRLFARPGSGGAERAVAGEFRLELPKGRRALLFVPTLPRHRSAAPLAVMLHGAGGTGEQMRFTFAEAERQSCVILAPSAATPTWDLLVDGFGRDVEAINDALAATFTRIAVDPGRLALGGFSDGASYALSLGIANAELFTHILAFSPGFVVGSTGTPRARIFISHGTRDDVLPIARTSRVIVPRLVTAGFDVTHREFEGPHAVPAPIVRDAFTWFMA